MSLHSEQERRLVIGCCWLYNLKIISLKSKDKFAILKKHNFLKQSVPLLLLPERKVFDPSSRSSLSDQENPQHNRWGRGTDC